MVRLAEGQTWTIPQLREAVWKRFGLRLGDNTIPSQPNPTPSGPLLSPANPGGGGVLLPRRHYRDLGELESAVRLALRVLGEWLGGGHLTHLHPQP